MLPSTGPPPIGDGGVARNRPATLPLGAASFQHLLGCENAEEVGGGSPPLNYKATYGWQAIEQDMLDATNGCFWHRGK